MQISKGGYKVKKWADFPRKLFYRPKELPPLLKLLLHPNPRYSECIMAVFRYEIKTQIYWFAVFSEYLHQSLHKDSKDIETSRLFWIFA